MDQVHALGRADLTARSGTGVGLVKTAQPAGETVRELREGAKQHLRKLAGLL